MSFHGIDNATTACRWTVKLRSPVKGQRITTKPQTATANHRGCARLRMAEGTKRARGPWKGGSRRDEPLYTGSRILIWVGTTTPAVLRAPCKGKARILTPPDQQTLKRGAKIGRR